MEKRLRRRVDEARMKASALRLIRRRRNRWRSKLPITKSEIGVMASTHNSPCSCLLCSYYDDRIVPKRERAARAEDFDYWSVV